MFFARESIAKAYKSTFDIFLSHSYTDKLIVTGLYALLTAAGFSVYIDWIFDSSLSRTTVTPATAAVLRRRMKQSASLMYATTSNHTSSKWMPWECGYYDGYDGHVAILPVLSYSQTSFAGQEYLGLYPHGKKSTTGYGRNALRIHNQANPSSSVTFDQWVGGSNP